MENEKVPAPKKQSPIIHVRFTDDEVTEMKAVIEEMGIKHISTLIQMGAKRLVREHREQSKKNKNESTNAEKNL